MATFIEGKCECTICGKKYKCWTGCENWHILERGRFMKPICKPCSTIIKRFVEYLKDINKLRSEK